MSRDMTDDQKDASVASTVNLAILMEADFDSGSLNLFTGYGSLVIDGRTYTGSGRLVTIDPAQEVAEVQANSATFQLSGVQESDIAVALAENPNGRPCRMKLAFFDASNAMIDDPLTVFAGRMDVPNLVDDPQNPQFTLSAENELIRLSRARNRNRTHEDQQIDYPGDRGLEFVAAMQNKTIYV